jgi:hypothetical protein
VHIFLQSHSNRQGIAVLGFITNDVDTVHERYQRLHPKLIHDFSKYDGDNVKILEVFAYYDEGNGEADTGTVLRFLEPKKGSSDTSGDVTGRSCLLLPGLTKISANFDRTSEAAYCDHWVSNVFSRTGFLSTLEDTLGFTPKIDFNAGVVAAGEAQIESTVTGNETTPVTANKHEALRDQSQVYLPINNALTKVG